MNLMLSPLMGMAQHLRNGEQERETFHKFFECWLSEQNQHLQSLVAASDGESEMAADLVDRVLKHYEEYYRVKSRWGKNHVLSMFNPSWRSSLEDAFMWIGGWRPSMAFHLLYSKSGLQLEASLRDLLQGLSTRDLGDLSPTQLRQVDELQKQTIQEEKDITEKLAKQQETVADTSMVELSHMVTQIRREEEEEVNPQLIDNHRIEETLVPKEEGLAEILHKADDLRLETLKKVLGILTPIQGVHFLIAAAELHLRVHEWGKNRDARLNHTP